MDDNGILEYFRTHKLSPTGIRNFLAYCDGAREYVDGQVAAHPEFRTPGGYINCLVRGITLSKCVICGKTLNYKAAMDGRTHCSMKCFAKDKDVVEGRNRTNLERYGVSNPSQVKEFKDRRSATIMDRYGVDSILKNPAFVKKQKQTMIDRYGVDSYQKTDQHKRKAYDQSYETILGWGDYVRPLFTREEYHGYKHGEIYRWKCSRCGNEFIGKIGGYGHISQNSKIPRCMSCFPYHFNESDEENELFDLITSVYDGEAVRHDRSVLNGMELDVFLPGIRMAFEFDGLFFHNEDSGKGADYHVSKTNACESNGIRLVQVFEDEWIERRPVVEHIVRGLLGGNNHVDAGICEAMMMDQKSSDLFFEENHLFGGCDCDLCYGLFLDGKAVFSMAFSEIEKGNWEITRYASRIGINVDGGVSRILDEFGMYHSGNVFCNVDRRYFIGEDLDMAGFERRDDSAPDFWWCRNKRKLSRHDCEMSGMTDEMMIKEGWKRIYDCGNRNFFKKIG